MGKAFMTSGEAQEKAIEETHEKINVLEEGMKGLFSEEAPKIDGQNFGLLDIMVCAVLSTHKASEEVLGNGVKILDPERHPFLSSWVEKLNKHPVVKENTPPYDTIIGFLHFITHKTKESRVC